MGETSVIDTNYIGGLCYNHVFGSVYLWAAVSTYVSSYFREKGYEYSASYYLLFVPIRGMAHSLSTAYGNLIESQYGPKLTLAATTGLFILLIFAASFCTHPMLFTLLFASAFGLAPSNSAGLRKEAGLRSLGTQLAYGLGTLFTAKFAQAYINPNNMLIEPTNFSYTSEISSRVPSLVRWLTVFWAVLLITSDILFTKSEQSNTYAEQLTQSHIESPDLISFEFEYEFTTECPDVKSGIKSTQFWLLLFFSTFTLLFDLLVGFAYKEIGFAHPDSFLTVTGGLYALIATMGGNLWKWMYYRLNVKALLVFIAIGEAGTVLAFVVSLLNRDMFGLNLLFIGVFISSRSLLPTIFELVFGKSVGSELSSHMNFPLAGLSLILYWVISSVLPRIGYPVLLNLIGILSLLRLLGIYYLNLGPRWPITGKNRKEYFVRSRQTSKYGYLV